MSVAALLEALAASTPAFPDAACRTPEHRAIFDDSAADPSKPTQICRTCPSLAACRDWYLSLPDDQKPVELVVAAEYRPATEPRRGPLTANTIQRLHEWARQHGPITAPQAARALGVTSNNAGNHLRRGVELGLFELGRPAPTGARPAVTYHAV